MPISTSQTINPNQRAHLKPLHWITPLIILAAIVGGFFAYQNYLMQKYETITATGVIAPIGFTAWQYGTHTLSEDGKILYALRSDAVSLDDYNGKIVEVRGNLKNGYPVAGGPLYLIVEEIREIPSQKTVTSAECGAQGGRIVNTLSGSGCDANETIIGEISGLRCPCVCCAPPL